MGQDKGLADFFLKKKPSKMVLALKNEDVLNAKKLSRKVETTYSHAVRVMNRMEEMEIVESTKKGRKKNYRLTDKGNRVSEALRDIVGSVKDSRKQLERDL